MVEVIHFQITQAAKFDGKMTSWYHFDCFFERQRPKSAGDIEHFDLLRWEDQEKINEKLKSKFFSSFFHTTNSFQEISFL